jgi:hypothetical protein
MNGDKGYANFSSKTIERFNRNFGKVKEFNVVCCKCQKIFSVHEREKLHPKREVYFCSKSCANKHSVSQETKSKISKSLTGRTIVNRIDKICPACSKEFKTIKSANRQYCSATCYRTSRLKIDKDSLKYYRSLCQFKFNLADYPDEFDFSLVESHGWYAAKNRGDNLGGVSRDHIVSAKHGFENGVDPAIIAHPANCRLLPHSANVSKGTDCGISLEDLLIRIQNWNLKYK